MTQKECDFCSKVILTFKDNFTIEIQGFDRLNNKFFIRPDICQSCIIAGRLNDSLKIFGIEIA